jgi:predicted transcriptional regulator
MPPSDPVTERLSPAQSAALVALLAGARMTEAADAAGVTDRTVRSWLATDPDFRAALLEAHSASWRGAVARLSELAGKAVAALEDVLDDEGATGATKIRAAEVILERVEKTLELEDLAKRLEALEQAAAERGEGKGSAWRQ